MLVETVGNMTKLRAKNGTKVAIGPVFFITE
jgi:hypothetical protein